MLSGSLTQNFQLKPLSSQHPKFGMHYDTFRLMHPNISEDTFNDARDAVKRGETLTMIQTLVNKARTSRLFKQNRHRDAANASRMISEPEIITLQKAYSPLPVKLPPLQHFSTSTPSSHSLSGSETPEAELILPQKLIDSKASSQEPSAESTNVISTLTTTPQPLNSASLYPNKLDTIPPNRYKSKPIPHTRVTKRIREESQERLVDVVLDKYAKNKIISVPQKDQTNELPYYNGAEEPVGHISINAVRKWRFFKARSESKGFRSAAPLTRKKPNRKQNS